MRLFAVVLIGCLFFPAGVRAAEPTEAARVEALVMQLGDNSFEVRDQATAALRELGPAAEKALRQGTQSDDPEVRSACEGLLAHLSRADREARLKAFLTDKDGTEDHGLAGWGRFAELVGRDPPVRALFVQVYRADAALLELAEKDTKEVASRLGSRAGGLTQALITPKMDDAAFTEAATLLFASSDPRVTVDAPTFAALCRGMEVFSNRKALRKKWVESAACRQLLLAFVRRREDEASVNLGLSTATMFELPEARDWAVSLAKDRNRSAMTRGLALLLAGRVGDKALVAKLEPLLTDTTAVGTKMLGSLKLSTELRDVALAALVQMSGGKIEEYSFPYLEAVPGLKALPDPVCLGFAGPVARDAALAKWQRQRPAASP